MTKLAIIGGTGLTSLSGLEITRREVVCTSWGEPSGPLTHGRLSGEDVTFLARHGYAHTIPPHQVNYRANIWALKQIGVEQIISVASVGGIHSDYSPGRLAVPDQIVDYTWGRGHTFFENELSEVVHIDFTNPYSDELRTLLLAAADAVEIDVLPGGTYGTAQGPRLETVAEIDRMERDGCHVVGMTGMPEAALAREAGLAYAHCIVVVNPAAGRGSGEIRVEDMAKPLEVGMAQVRALLAEAVKLA